MAHLFNGDTKTLGAQSRVADKNWTPQHLKDITNDVEFDPKRAVFFGGGADIYKGTYGGRAVALKLPRHLTRIPDEDTTRRFFREIAYWSKVKHRNILEVVGIVNLGESLYVVSWWAQNGTVAQYTKKNPGVLRYPIICGIMSAVNHLHENDIVHGDIKGSNILISDTGEPMITDFGLSKVSTNKTSSAIAGSGTLHWSAPELFNGHSKSKASDVYATAMVIYEILTLQTPFAWLSNIESVVIQSVLIGTRPPCTKIHSVAGEIYAPYWKIAQDGWVHEPSNRPKIHDLLARLSKLTPQFVPLAVPSPPTPSAPIVVANPQAIPAILHAGDMYMRSGENSFSSPSTSVQGQHHFQLVGSSLNYYALEDITHANLVGSIQLLNHKSVNYIDETSTGYEFSLRNSRNQPVYFSVATDREAKEWSRCINKSMIHLRRGPNGDLPGNPIFSIPIDKPGRIASFFLRFFKLEF